MSLMQHKSTSCLRGSSVARNAVSRHTSGSACRISGESRELTGTDCRSTEQLIRRLKQGKRSIGCKVYDILIVRIVKSNGKEQEQGWIRLGKVFIKICVRIPSEGQRGADEGKMMARVNDICNFAKVNPEEQAGRQQSWNRSSMKMMMTQRELLLLSLSLSLSLSRSLRIPSYS